MIRPCPTESALLQPSSSFKQQVSEHCAIVFDRIVA
ncbi:MAG: hypothetical protein ACJAXA_002275, partial [Candidatus Aldehydirespiratoraceae bacterium]